MTHVSQDTPALIDCRTAARALYDYLDGRLPHASHAEVHQHLATCADCADHFTFARRLLNVIPAAFPIEPEAQALRRRIVEALRSEGFSVDSSA